MTGTAAGRAWSRVAIDPSPLGPRGGGPPHGAVRDVPSFGSVHLKLNSRGPMSFPENQ